MLPHASHSVRPIKLFNNEHPAIALVFENPSDRIRSSPNRAAIPVGRGDGGAVKRDLPGFRVLTFSLQVSLFVCLLAFESALPAAACQTERAAGRIQTRSGDSGGLCHPGRFVSTTAERNAQGATRRIDCGARLHRKCSVHRCWGRLGTNRCRRHLGLEADRWDRARAAAFPWGAEYRRNKGRHRRLAPDAARVAQPLARSVRSRTSVRHDDAVGPDTAFAVPFSAATSPRQPGLRS